MADPSTPKSWSNDALSFKKAPLAPGDWEAGAPVVVQCDTCNHEWVYTGVSRYAQCKCGRSNQILGVPDE